jgi:four helix bundle protein
MAIEEYKFQKLKVYQMALEYLDEVYEIGKKLPETEKYNLRSQLERAATSIPLNIAEGSTSQSDAEQNRFLAMAMRSFLETVACFDIIERRNYIISNELSETRIFGHQLFISLQAFRKTLHV